MKNLRKTYILLLGIFVVLISCKSQKFAGGNGTEEHPYLIENRLQLHYFANAVNSDTNFSSLKYFALSKDISLENDTNLNPIGTSEKPFTGTFDGRNHSILNLNVKTDKKGIALFGYNNGTVRNLTLKSSSINGNSGISGICNSNAGVVENCINYASIEGKDGSVGGNAAGIVNWNQGVVRNCINYGAIIGKVFNTGGICAFNLGTIENCINCMKIIGNKRNGGICGYNKGVVKNCLSLSPVIGQTETGAICGKNDNDKDYYGNIQQIGTIENCFFNTDSCNIEPIGVKAEKTVDTNVVGYNTEKIKSGTLFNDSANWIEKKGKYPMINPK